MFIRYYLDGIEFASRTRDLIPRSGEEIRFNHVLFIIKRVVWIEDEAREYVAIDIVKEG